MCFATHGSPQSLMSDNARQFTSAEFKNFATQWDINHITSSPTYPQSNGLAERAVQSAKSLLEKCKRDGTDIYMALLEMRNVPRDNHLGSPAQRLFSRRTRTVLPISKKLLVPSPVEKVQQNLKKARGQRKRHYDKSAKPLKPLKPDQTVRIQTKSGYDRLAVVKREAAGPRSYVVVEDGKELVRNRKHLLPVAEPKPIPKPTPEPPAEDFAPRAAPEAQPAQAPIAQPRSPVRHARPNTPKVHSPAPPPKAPVISRYGRVSKPNPKYSGYTQ